MHGIRCRRNDTGRAKLGAAGTVLVCTEVADGRRQGRRPASTGPTKRARQERVRAGAAGPGRSFGGSRWAARATPQLTARPSLLRRPRFDGPCRELAMDPVHAPAPGVSTGQGGLGQMRETPIIHPWRFQALVSPKRDLSLQDVVVVVVQLVSPIRCFTSFAPVCRRYLIRLPNQDLVHRVLLLLGRHGRGPHQDAEPAT